MTGPAAGGSLVDQSFGIRIPFVRKAGLRVLPDLMSARLPEPAGREVEMHVDPARLVAEPSPRWAVGQPTVASSGLVATTCR